MENQKVNEQRYIELEGVQTPVSEDVYFAYYRPVWAEEKRLEREGRCRDKNGHRCMNDCSECDKTRTGTLFSLEKSLEVGIDAADTTDIAEEVEKRIIRQAVRAALEQLPDALNRRIITLSFYCEMTEREIADVVGLSQKTVNNRKRESLMLMRPLLEDYRQL